MISDLGVFQNCWQENDPGESGREEPCEIGVTGKILKQLGKKRCCLERLEMFMCYLNSACEEVSDEYPFCKNRNASDNAPVFVI